MKLQCLLVPLTVLLLAADTAKEDQAKLQGEWTVAEMQYDGQKASDDDIKAFRRKIDGKSYTVTITKDKDVQKVEGTFTLDPTAKPKAVDVMTKDRDGKDITIKGIYEIAGDTHKLCMAPVGEARPNEFASTEGSRRTLIVWKRVKP